MKSLCEWPADKSKMFLFEVNLFTIKIDKVNVGLAILIVKLLTEIISFVDVEYF